MKPEDRVHALAREGKVTAEEAARLEAALAAASPSPPPAPKRSPLWLLVDPFVRFGGAPAAIAGVIVAAAGVATSRAGVRYDGFLDMHVGHALPALHVAVAEQIIDVVLGAAVLFATARLFGSRGRLLDVAGAIGLSRAPFVLFSVPVAELTPPVAGGALEIAMTPSLAAMIVLALASVVWTFTLYTTGVRNATGLRGGKLAVALVGGGVAAEIVTKLALHLLV